MRILIGSYPAVTILEGGVRTQAVSLQSGLVQLGHQAELFETWRSYPLKEFDWFYLVGAHVGTVHLARAVKQLGVRLAVSPVYFSRRSPRIVGWRTGWVDLWQGATRLKTESHAPREVCMLADRVLPNTQAEADLVTTGLGIPAAKVRVVPNGCDERFARATPDAFIRAHELRPGFVLYVGHVGLGRKNLLSLVRAMTSIDRPLVVIGKVLDNDYARECLAGVKALKHSLVIPGLEHESELFASALAACDVLCLPSLFETPGLAALEAGLAGAKIVITKYGGTTEYFGDRAEYVEPGSVSSIRDGLRRALAAPRDTRLKERIGANYLWTHAAKRLAAVLAEK